MECEIPQFYAHSEHIAQKPHRCCECIAPILPGEKYFLARGKWDDRFSVYRQHLLCEAACEYVRDNFNDECIGFGTLFEWIHEEAYDFDEFRCHEKGKIFRSMIAKIKRRERSGK